MHGHARCPHLLPVLILSLGVVGAQLLPAQDHVFLSGAQIALVPLVNGGVSADGADAKWDHGYRVELSLRDYYFDQQAHHPFAELGFFYESHETSTGSVDLDAETFAVRGSVGSAIPLWRTANDSLSAAFTF